MPSFAERLSDGPIADLANYLRTSWGNKAAANATASMVAAWRTTANVPDYGTQAAAGFKCPLVGGGPGSSGPNPQAVADLAVMIQAGDRKIADLGATYRRAAPDAGAAEVVDALMAAYCPVIAASSAPTYQKVAELRRFAMQAEGGVSAQATAVPYPEIDVIWASPVGHTLVYRNLRPFAGKLACPANDGSWCHRISLPRPPRFSANRACLSRATQPVSSPAASRHKIRKPHRPPWPMR
jgi:hypothetical protein